jgi:hypothetical protein
MMHDTLRNRLWHEAETRNVYAVLDGAQNAELLDWLYAHDAPQFHCLFAGAIAPDIAEVAPYVVALDHGSRFATELVEGNWVPNFGVFLVSDAGLESVWRHLRQLTLVYGPDLESLYFRFYDPRVLRTFLPTCNSTQLEEFFGCVNFFFSEGDSGAGSHVWSRVDGQLVEERIGDVQNPRG